MGRRRRSKDSQYWIGMVTGGTIVFALFVGLFIFYQNHFGTYENVQYKFKMKVPVTWTLQENVDGAAAVFATQLDGELDTFRENVNIVVQDTASLPQPKNFRDYTKDAIRQLKIVFKHNMEVEESTSTTWIEQEAHKFVFYAQGEGFRLKYFILWTLKGTMAYQFTYTAMESNYDKYYDLVAKMARSFQLIEGVAE